MSAILEARGLHKQFGGLTAVADVNLTIAEREIHCLIGPNGAGKSTFFKLLLGTYKPNAGQVYFRGEDVTGHEPFDRVLRGMSIKMQVPAVFRELPVRQNLTIALQRRLPKARITRAWATCWSCWNSPTTPTSWRASCRTVSSSGWRSAWRWRWSL